MSLKERFSANLRPARRKAGITQEELATLIELHRTQISHLERAKRMPRLDTLGKICCALDCRADELVEGLAWEARPRRLRALGGRR